jgi:hypothetical protein
MGWDKTNKILKVGDGVTAWNSLAAWGNGTYQPLATSFERTALAAALSNTNFNSFSQNSAFYLAAGRSSSGVQNDQVVFDLGCLLMSGTWTFEMTHRAFTDRGIYTISASTDNSNWTDLATIDGYNGSAAEFRDTATVTMPNLTQYLRFKMATKNASASSYIGFIHAFGATRTGA